MKGQLRSRDQRALELQVETEQLQEQAARQNAVIASLKKMIQVYVTTYPMFLTFVTLK